MSLQRRLMSLGRSGDLVGLTRINFNYINDEGEILGDINPNLSYNENSWTLNNVRSLAIENGNEVTITYPKFKGYITPDESKIYMDGATKDLQITYVKNLNGWNYVDLGLSVLWATCNVGATTVEDYGDIYFFGGTVPNPKNVDFSSYSNISSSPDENGNLPISYDTARNKMGGSWRMPTKDEFQELIDNTTKEWTSLKGTNGYLLTSKINSQTIFFPASGSCSYYSYINEEEGKRGYYWSSTIKFDEGDDKSGYTNVYELSFGIDIAFKFTYGSLNGNYEIKSVRGVLDK